MEIVGTPTSSAGRGSTLGLLLLGGSIVIADQIVKLIVVNTMRMGLSIDVIGTVVRLTF